MSGFMSSGSVFTGNMSPEKHCSPVVPCAMKTVDDLKSLRGDRDTTDGEVSRLGEDGLVSVLVLVDVSVGCDDS